MPGVKKHLHTVTWRCLESLTYYHFLGENEAVPSKSSSNFLIFELLSLKTLDMYIYQLQHSLVRAGSQDHRTLPGPLGWSTFDLKMPSNQWLQEVTLGRNFRFLYSTLTPLNQRVRQSRDCLRIVSSRRRCMFTLSRWISLEEYQFRLGHFGMTLRFS